MIFGIGFKITVKLFQQILRQVVYKATSRHRTKRLKGCLSRDGMLHMMFKLAQCAQKNWRRLRSFDYLAKVVIGVKFKDGIEVTRANQAAA